ncbi:MAG: hypothetical protein GWN85_41575, partial [Gemmatimonadetes bacterium]|nr:hypothetical protein [Gemmatimonadota bacterium]
MRRLLESGGDGALAGMAALDGGFADELAAYRRNYGCRALRYEVAELTLGERDDLLLQLLRDQLSIDISAADAAAAERRDGARARARRALEGRTEADRLRFETALRRAATVYPVREDNEFLTVGVPLALVRAVCREYGGRLADRGQLAAPDDVFFLEID